MSRIGNNPISIPEGVSVSENGDVITVKGKNGEMNQNFDGVSFNISDDTIIVKRNSETPLTILKTRVLYNPCLDL
jgi:large subunit ribosomal protein L6